LILVDVNVLVYAHRQDMPDHAAFRDWLTSVVNGEGAYGLSDLVLSTFIRVLTNPKAFNVPTVLAEAVAAADRLRGQPNCVLVSPGPMHWDIFVRLCREAGTRGNLVADAYLAALAIESGAEWITTDRDFSRFPGLRWRHPTS
jgi:uncharacterized protein